MGNNKKVKIGNEELDAMLQSISDDVDKMVEYYKNNSKSIKKGEMKYFHYALTDQSLDSFDKEKQQDVSLKKTKTKYANKGVYIFVAKSDFTLSKFKFNSVAGAPLRDGREKIKNNEVFYVGTSQELKKRLWEHISFSDKNLGTSSMRLKHEKRSVTESGEKISENLVIYSFQLKKHLTNYYSIICPYAEAQLQKDLKPAVGNRSKSNT